MGMEIRSQAMVGKTVEKDENMKINYLSGAIFYSDTGSCHEMLTFLENAKFPSGTE